MTVCLEAPWRELTGQDIRSVVEPLPEEGLKTLLGSLKQRLRGEAAERGRIWRDKVHPWLRDYWPRAAARNTAGTSEAILEILAECGDAFPEAAEWSLEYLRPLEGWGLYRLGENGLAEQDPDSMLRVLDRVVDADVLPGHQRHSASRGTRCVGCSKCRDGWRASLSEAVPNCHTVTSPDYSVRRGKAPSPQRVRIPPGKCRSSR